MTNDRIVLRELLENGSDAMFLREMIGIADQRPMGVGDGGLCEAGDGDSAPEQMDQRDGYRDREW